MMRKIKYLLSNINLINIALAVMLFLLVNYMAVPFLRMNTAFTLPRVKQPAIEKVASEEKATEEKALRPPITRSLPSRTFSTRKERYRYRKLRPHRPRRCLSPNLFSTGHW